MAPMGCSPPGSSAHGVSQARIPEWVVISSSRGTSQPRDQTDISCVVGGFFTVEHLLSFVSGVFCLLLYSICAVGLFSCLVALAGTFSMTFNGSSKSGHPCVDLVLETKLLVSQH